MLSDVYRRARGGCVVVLAATVIAGFPKTSQASMAAPPAVQWTVGSGGNGHWYQLVIDPGLTYDQAKTAAAGLTYADPNTKQVLQGSLLVLDNSDYTAEFNFTFDKVFTPYLPANQRSYWIGASSPTGNSGDWTWINGSTVPKTTTDGWAIDHFEGPGREGATYYDTGDRRVYDYLASASSLAEGYVVEYQSVPEPASLALIALGGLLMLPRRRQVAD